ncbi:UNKNOWN [Stylonychia lemnae]|uniref:Uncharacterized protein n=1 Tax=Stylonychia lemnae TaxID=5949 RepID=A0A078AQI9_STYLE|nr:UNKNOWN [Stylonychia lemnae]|eukprot:CDW83517.1 UNKNOWN [Stylonychia lemnae]
MVQLNDDIFICGQNGGQITFLSIQNQQYSQTFKINKLQHINEIYLVKRDQNEYSLVLADDNSLHPKGMTIIKFVKKSDYDYQLIDQKSLKEKEEIISIMLVKSQYIIKKNMFGESSKESFTIAYTTGNPDHSLKIFESRKKKQIHCIKLQGNPYIFKLEDYDYELNPIAFVKDNQRISLINLKNYQIVKVIDSKYNHLHSRRKESSLKHLRINKEEAEKVYKLIDVQRDQDKKFVEIREIIVNLNQITNNMQIKEEK